MKKEEKTSKIKKKKEEKYKLVDAERLKKVELIISLIVGVIFLVLLVLSIINVVFLPATLILFALFLFCICYYYIEDESKKKMVYILFGLGVLTTISEWTQINAPAKKKILYTFTFPIFIFTYIPISIVALFKKIEWKPITHSVVKTIEEVRQ